MNVIDASNKTDEEVEAIRLELQAQLDADIIGFWAFTVDNTFESGSVEEIPARRTPERKRYLVLSIAD